MANPQKENGYTPIANEILERIMRVNLSGTQFRIVMAVWRYTYGFNRKHHAMSVTFIANAVGTSRSRASNEIKMLVEKNILEIIKPSTFKSPAVIGFHKDYDMWIDDTVPVIESDTVPVIESDTVPVIESDTGVLSNPVTKKEILKKDLKKDFKDKYISAREEIIDYLNMRLGTRYKSTTKGTARLIIARLNEGHRPEDFREVIDKKAVEWRHRPDMAQYLRPETLFGNKFEGYLNQPWTDGRKPNQTEIALAQLRTEENIINADCTELTHSLPGGEIDEYDDS